jgi:periplasmic protein TonB
MTRMMSPSNVPEELFLPWVESSNDRRFKKILIVFVTSFVLISAIVPFLPTPEIIQKDLKTVAPRLSRLIIEQKKIPPPPLPEVKKKVKKKPVKKKKKVDKKDTAYKKAASSGLVALSSELDDLKNSFDFSSLDNKPLKKSKGVEKQTFKTNVITAKATTASAGIETGKLTRTTGGSKLSGRTTTKVTSEISEKVAPVRRSSADGRGLLRDEREIEQVFQKNKGAIYSIYNRALRKDPTLQGKVVVELTIAPNGKVTQCRIISSELNTPDLERKIVARIKLFKFKSANVPATTVKYPIDFLPS